MTDSGGQSGEGPSGIPAEPTLRGEALEAEDGLIEDDEDTFVEALTRKEPLRPRAEDAAPCVPGQLPESFGWTSVVSFPWDSLERAEGRPARAPRCGSSHWHCPPTPQQRDMCIFQALAGT